MSYSLNMKINKFLMKMNYDISVHGYFRNKKELIKFIKLSKYFSINKSPNKNYSKNILIRKFNCNYEKKSNIQNPNLIALSKDEYISEFSKSNTNNMKMKGKYFHSCKRVSSPKITKKKSLNDMKNKLKFLYTNNKSDERYNQAILNNHKIIMSNVKKFLNINNIEDENKGISFPYINTFIFWTKIKKNENHK